MSEKMDTSDALRVLARGGYIHITEADARDGTWTDGLPHDFNGWGPQTPDPDNPQAAMPLQLQWRDEGETHAHHVWRFDMRRHHH